MNHEIAAAMRQYGGSFVKELATLWVIADSENRQRIENAWPEIIERYAAFVPQVEPQTAEKP